MPKQDKSGQQGRSANPGGGQQQRSSPGTSDAAGRRTGAGRGEYDIGEKGGSGRQGSSRRGDQFRDEDELSDMSRNRTGDQM